ncbi:MAG: SH3 domain-containing protein [Candidatus Zixiibacteriota bacterium]
MLFNKKGTVIKSYRTAYPDPLIIKKGERLTVGEKESEWTGWTWCTNAKGKSGWAPESYLSVKGDTAVSRCDYDATELTVAAGEKLTVLGEESGWVRAAKADGATGWVPRECVKFTD